MLKRQSTSVFIAGLMLAFCIFQVLPAFAQTAGGFPVKSIQVLGNENVESAYILGLLSIRAGDYIGTNALTVIERNADILDRTGYFRERPILSYESYEDGAILVVEVKEWPLLKEIQFTGNTLYTGEELQAEVYKFVQSRGNDVRKQKLEELKSERKRIEKELKNRQKSGETAEAGEATNEIPVELPELPDVETIEVSEADLWGGNPPLEPGKIINMRTLEWALVNGVLGFYQNQGYIAAWVRDLNIEVTGENTGVITVEIGEGFVDEILISGFQKTKERIIRREIRSVQIGEPLKQDALRDDFRRLVNTGLFAEVRPDWEPSIKPGYIKLLFDVTETNTGQFGFGAAYSTVNGLQGTISFKENNLFGEGKNVSAMVIFTQDSPGFEIEYRDPNVQSRDMSFSAKVYNLHTRQQRNPGTVKESELKLDTWGASVGVGKRFTETMSGAASLNVSENHFDVIKGDPFSHLSPIRRARLTQEGQTRSLTLSGFYDTRDNRFSTKEGNFAAVSAEFAGFGGDFDFRKYTQEYRHFFPVGRHTFGFRERLGLAEGNLPIFEEFRLGGAYSIRGVDDDFMAGSKSLLLNTEFRYSLDKKEQVVLALFSDMGWTGESFSSMQSEKTAGIGVHFQLPQIGFGAIRLDYGWQLTGDNNQLLHFGIGEMF